MRILKSLFGAAIEELNGNSAGFWSLRNMEEHLITFYERKMASCIAMSFS